MIKRFMIINIALAVSFFVYSPLANSIDNTEYQTAYAEDVKRKIDRSDPSNHADNIPMIERLKSVEGLDVYIAGSNVVLPSGSTLSAGSFIPKTHEGQSAVDSIYALDDTTKIVKLPDQQKKNFSIYIKGQYNNLPIKIYSGPDEKFELSSNFVRPDSFKTNDLNVYNGKFVRVKTDDDHDVFINLDASDWKLDTKSKYKIVGMGNSLQVIPNQKNLTMDLNARTNVTREDLLKITGGTDLEGIEDAVLMIEDQYGINAFFTLGVAITETGWGRSNFAKERNNLFGICAYDSNVNAASHFVSKAACIEYWGSLIHDEYFAKGRTTLESINAIYASNPQWASSVGWQMRHGIAAVSGSK